MADDSKLFPGREQEGHFLGCLIKFWQPQCRILAFGYLLNLIQIHNSIQEGTMSHLSSAPGATLLQLLVSKQDGQ